MEIPSNNIFEDPLILDQLQDEVFQLMGAWVDRGVSPNECGQILTGMGHMLLARTGIKLSELLEVLTSKWSEYGGSP